MAGGPANGREKAVIDKEKIILMTKLAVYEKNEGAADKRKMEYFLNDYVYRRNIGIRARAMIGCAIVIMLYALHRIIIDNADIISGIDYAKELGVICAFAVSVLVAYSIIGSAVNIADYHAAGKRIKTYLKTIDDLEKRRKIMGETEN
jgi:hypothetical protein